MAAAVSMWIFKVSIRAKICGLASKKVLRCTIEDLFHLFGVAPAYVSTKDRVRKRKGWMKE